MFGWFKDLKKFKWLTDDFDTYLKQLMDLWSFVSLSIITEDKIILYKHWQALLNCKWWN